MIRTDSPLSSPSPSIRNEEEIPKKSFGAKALHVAQMVAEIALCIVMLGALLSGYVALWVFFPMVALLISSPFIVLIILGCGHGIGQCFQRPDPGALGQGSFLH